MTKFLIVILLTANCFLAQAQTIKTDVLVIGNGACGAAAAIQCARSKIKTVYFLRDSLPFLSPQAPTMCTIGANRNIQSGIWGEFRKRVHDFYKKIPGYDTSNNAVLRFEPNTGASILKKIADTVKNLTVYINGTFTAIKKNGDGWDVSFIRSGKTIDVKTRIVVDATDTGEVASKAGVKITARYTNNNTNQFKTYRTSIAAIEESPELRSENVKTSNAYYPPFPAYIVPIRAMLSKDADNLLIAEKVLMGKQDIQSLSLQLETGQGIGTVAAYCAFFKTTTKNLNVRTIQGELLDFKGYLLPFTDIPLKDRNWRAIQQVCATGLLKGVLQTSGDSTKFAFNPDSLVKTDEVKPVLTEIYTRAFLWFIKEKPGEKFTIANLLSFIGDHTLTNSQVLIGSVQKAWKTQYRFTTDFDLNRQVTRREFAVLANRFLNPFARTVDLDGNVVN
ncbi:MAG TPA: FAD-dependent oxidoreductase [Mucilaginibacter sp.]|jgi:hypothetical protein